MNEPRSQGPDAARFLFGAREGVRIAFTALRTNPFRSALTVLGVGIGVCVVVLMAALVSGVRGSIQEGIESAGPRNFSLLRVDPDDVQLVNAAGTRRAWEDRPRFTLEEVDRVSRLEGVLQVLPQYVLSGPGGTGGGILRMGSVEVSGVFTTGEGPGWQVANSATFVEGRDLVPVEFEEARHVVVLSERVARSLDPLGSVVGRQILVQTAGRTLPLTVVGVFEPVEIPFEEATGYRAVIPHTTAIRRFRTDPELEGFTVVPAPEAAVDAVEDAVIATLRTLRGLSPGVENDFSILRSTQILEIFDRFTAVFFIVMLALSSVGLLVGGVGVV
jgi:putative ABC transport system permease protein